MDGAFVSSEVKAPPLLLIGPAEGDSVLLSEGVFTGNSVSSSIEAAAFTGAAEGCSLEAFVAFKEGFATGTFGVEYTGAWAGFPFGALGVGFFVGATINDFTGAFVGFTGGSTGAFVGAFTGDFVDALTGDFVGLSVGDLVGSFVGTGVGFRMGAFVG